MLGIETLWEKYVAYEQRVNLPDSPSHIEEMHAGYANTKRFSQELESVMRGLNKGALSVPPTGTPAEMAQVELWKRYIAWEKSNPTCLNLDTHFELHKKRVMFAFEQALLCLSHHADIWIEGRKQVLESNGL
jgi:cleavage stimulation factor subunit 3